MIKESVMADSKTAPKSRKRGATKIQTDNVTVEMSNQNRSVKRRIDFNEKDGNSKQKNNNAMVRANEANDKQTKTKKKVTPQMITRATKAAMVNLNNEKGLDCTKPTHSSYRVQWTKEFLDKVKRSNQKFADKQQSRNDKITAKIVKPISFQKGDSVCTEVEIGKAAVETDVVTDLNVIDSDLELLDYEDDLSMDEEFEENGPPPPTITETSRPVSSKVRKGPQPCDNVVPGTSSGSTAAATTETELMIQKLNSQPKEVLMENPIIQRMMTKFFEDKFKDLQRSSSKNKKPDREGVERVGNAPQVGSGSSNSNYRFLPNFNFL